ncbi:hypothetical protein BpHYR1_000438 [Brachionus plicatilis]|uniref:Uncharacterized protein n=1 Tax=Brachionus plicatilis TaxID=10195 RepID=A0A3M7PKZ9_BRAPC|nr:hypothetical protein BpHYR1_000438 [Brachionus plicatilis]
MFKERFKNHLPSIRTKFNLHLILKFNFSLRLVSSPSFILIHIVPFIEVFSLLVSSDSEELGIKSKDNIYGGSKKTLSGFNFSWKKKIFGTTSKRSTKRVEKTPPTRIKVRKKSLNKSKTSQTSLDLSGFISKNLYTLELSNSIKFKQFEIQISYYRLNQKKIVNV